MKKELKDVLHYYLPYKVEMTTTAKGRSAYITTIKRRLKKVEILTPELYDIMIFLRRKPILHPLSRLTEEIEHEGEKIVPKNIIVNWHTLPAWWNDGYAQLSDIQSIPFYVIQLLLKWHFDIFGLIESNQAIEKTI